MAPITAEDIREKMLAGLTTEAMTLLTMVGNDLAETDRTALQQELTRLQHEMERLLTRGDALEQQGRIDEAREVYENACRLSSDFPGIQDNLKRIDEALLLSRAIKRRSERLRQVAPALPPSAPKKKPVLLYAGLAVGLVVLLAGVAALRDRPPVAPQATVQPVARQETAPAPDPHGGENQSVSPSRPAEQAPVKEKAATIDQESITAATVAPPALPAPDPEPVATPPEPAPAETPPAPAPAATSAQQNGRSPLVYTVQPGDSLSTIADRELCKQALWEEIYRLNRGMLTNPQKLEIGLQLNLEGLKNHCGKDRR